ncbi:MAG: hypothetical protein J2P18_07265 [Nocardia sp.]|nr:hypothetical protein [Nocardia sp.]
MVDGRTFTENLGQAELWDTVEPLDRVLPEPEAEDFEWAREHPGEWQYFSDPRADKSSLTEQNIIGGYHAGEDGEVNTWLNPEYVPANGYAYYDAESPLELAIWRLKYGFGPVAQFLDAFRSAELIVVLPEDDPQGERGWPSKPGYEGEQVLGLYTSSGRMPPFGPPSNPWLWRRVSGLDIIERWAIQKGSVVVLNPAGEGNCYLELYGSALRRWWHDLQAAELPASSSDWRPEPDGT